MVEKRITPDDVARRVRRLLTEDTSPPVLVIGSGGSTSTKPGRDIGFKNPMTASGDLIQGGSSGAATRLGIGTTGHVLTVVSGKPAWAAGARAATRDLLTNGDATSPELIFAGGDVIWIEA